MSQMLARVATASHCSPGDQATARTRGEPLREGDVVGSLADAYDLEPVFLDRDVAAQGARAQHPGLEAGEHAIQEGAAPEHRDEVGVAAADEHRQPIP
jgi:hypothetical protein